MPIPSTVDSQRDFSCGEVDVSLKRSEDAPEFKAGLRQCSNFRILNSKKLSNRLGRSVKFQDGPRVDEILMSPGNIFYLIFGNGYLRIRNAAGAQVFNSTVKGDGSTAIPWTTSTVKSIVWDIYSLSIYIFYADGAPANVPQILTWDGVSQSSTWTLTTFAEGSVGNQKQTLFYRIAPLGITLTPSATTGSVTLTFSSNVLVAGMVGTRIRYAGAQILITAVSSGTSGTGTVEETLGGTVIITMNANPTGNINIGDVVIGAQSNFQGQVTNVTTTTITVVITRLGSGPYAGGLDYDGTGNELIVAPTGAYSQATTARPASTTPSASTYWDQEVMNGYQGWPSSGFFDQGRLGLCNFPSVPQGLAWSQIGVFNNFYIPLTTVTVSSAIFEICPNKSQVLYVVPGAESSEFVFCDNAIYYILINSSNPLSGSVGVSFQRITSDGSAPVKPALIQEALVYVSSGQATVRAITATGAYQRPYEVRHLSKLHDHLLNAPIAIAGPSANASGFPERYIYVLNGNGTLAVAKIEISDGVLKEAPGWVSESSAGSINWASARGSDVIFTTTYANTGATSFTVVEAVDFTQYLDCAQLYGGGPVAYLANGKCTVMDLGTRQMGTYSVDGTGHLIPQGIGGENLASSQLVVGQAWTAIAEPFIPAPGPGQSVGQRMYRKRVKRMFVAVEQSTGFVLQQLFAGPLTRTSPALGTVTRSNRVVTYNEDDDATQPPPLREDTYLWRTIGRSHDPRRAIVKDTAGPLVILDVGFDVTV
jgi:hypothetical protein